MLLCAALPPVDVVSVWMLPGSAAYVYRVLCVLTMILPVGMVALCACAGISSTVSV